MSYIQTNIMNKIDMTGSYTGKTDDQHLFCDMTLPLTNPDIYDSYGSMFSAYTYYCPEATGSKRVIGFRSSGCLPADENADTAVVMMVQFGESKIDNITPDPAGFPTIVAGAAGHGAYLEVMDLSAGNWRTMILFSDE